MKTFLGVVAALLVATAGWGLSEAGSAGGTPTATRLATTRAAVPAGLRSFSPALTRKGLDIATDPRLDALSRLHFEPGVDSRAAFVARNGDYGVVLDPTGAAIVLRGPSGHSSELHLSFEGGNAKAEMSGEQRLASVSNYRVGARSSWRTGVPNYGRVRCRDIYPGVDVDYHGRKGALEFDLVLHAGVSPGSIRMGFRGAKALSIRKSGDLEVGTASGPMIFHAPVAYQETPSGRRNVTSRFRISGGEEVGFTVGPHDPRLPLVIDPTLAYSTYFGGSTGFTYPSSIAVDGNGNIYIVGNTKDTDLPDASNSIASTMDAFVTKLGSDGQPVWTTYLGGSDKDVAQAVAVDSSGNVYIAGYTQSTDFPVTDSAYQGTHPEDSDVTVTAAGTAGYITELNGDGSILYSTYFGAASGCEGIALDGSGYAYVAGVTYADASHFPIKSAYQSTFPGGSYDGFVAKLDTTQSGDSSLVYSTYLGGSSDDGCYSLAVTSGGEACASGWTDSTDFPLASAYDDSFSSSNGTNFVSRLSSDGTSLVFSTFLDGSTEDENLVFTSGVAVDSDGNVYVTGAADSSFQTTSGAYQTSLAKGNNSEDAYVAKFDSGGSLVYATYLGGSAGDGGYAIRADGNGHAYVVGVTSSSSKFPLVDAIQSSYGGGDDAFIAELSADGSSLLFSTYLGGSFAEGGWPMGLALSGTKIFVTSGTMSTDFPVTSDAYQATDPEPTDSPSGFVSVIDLSSSSSGGGGGGSGGGGGGHGHGKP